ncbi:MAG: flagellar hook-basal body complex protein [candidate division KSB1 bacterium]|nr:flagellar hook-basal body complex protein [candidate division KSB1 bacterium]
MMRSLFAGVSGLRNHQLQMDVIGHNIANVNTVGFKAGRVTFQESLAQLLRAASRPGSQTGGQNPMQVGTGMNVGAVDTLFTQGSLQPTGLMTDLAIQGDGFFIVSDGALQYYTRAGTFQIDANGALVHPGTGYILQGVMADADGTIQPSSAVQNIVLPFGQKVPARATTLVSFSCNLDADTQALAQILAGDLSSHAVVTATGAPTSLTIVAGTNDTLTITVDNDAGGTVTKSITLAAGTYASVDDLVAEINAKLRADTSLNGEVIAELATVGTATVVRLRTVDAGGSSTKLAVAGNAATNLKLPATTATGTTASTAINSLPQVTTALTAGDVIRISGLNPDGSVVNSTYTYAAGDTVQDLLDAINAALSGATASLDSEGRLLVTDNVAGTSMTNLSLTLDDVDSSGSLFRVPQFLMYQEGRDAGTHTASIEVYDSLGQTHNLAITFTNISTSSNPNRWSWEVVIDDGKITPSSGSKGTVSFNSDGSLLVFSSNDGQPLTFNPGNGAETVAITLDAGRGNDFAGITQLRSVSTTVAKSQDGYGMGNLQSISIDATGRITGQFSNGVSQVLAQVLLANFTNPAGLEHAGDNLYLETANSGNAVKGVAGTTIAASISAGALEMSNVDLAEEFTQMIIAQRGFQANARVIATSDTILDEIVRLKR